MHSGWNGMKQGLRNYFCCDSHSLGVMPVMALKVR